MQLDPSKRYLLARPMGGFNDVMVQFEKCRRYAEQHNRVLVLDMSKSGVREHFDALFEVPTDCGCEIVVWSDDMAEAFDAETSVLPKPLQGNLSAHRIKWDRTKRCNFDPDTNCFTTFDFLKDHDEHVLLHAQCGGGVLSMDVLSHLVLRQEIARGIVEKLLKLDMPYVAVHIRHSDYRTKFSRFLRLLRPMVRNRTLLICSDNRKAKDTAASLLHSTTTLQSVSDIPNLNGRPIHFTKTVDAHQSNLDLLTDLIALSLSRRLYFTRLSRTFKYGVKISGYSILAELLRNNRDIVWGLLSLAETDELKKRADTGSDALTLWEKLYYPLFYMVNFEAENKITEISRQFENVRKS